MSLHPKVKGAPKEMTDGKVNVKGAWKQAAKILTKVNGAWKECWANLAVNMVLNYGIQSIPLEGTTNYVRLIGLSIVAKDKVSGEIVNTYEKEEQETGSFTLALPNGQLLFRVRVNELIIELWSSAETVELKIKKIEFV